MSSAPSKPPAAGPPPPERKAVKGPVITPQVLAIALGIILVIAIIVYYQAVIVAFKNQKEQLTSERTNLTSQISTYEKKKGKLDKAHDVNLALREKLYTLDYLFLVDQTSIVPFFETSLFPLLDASRLQPGADTRIVVEEYEFQINMAMSPFRTLPRSQFFENAETLFPIHYVGEKNGVPIETAVDTRPGVFLEPYHITLEKWYGTYEDCASFIEDAQQSELQDIMMTVHCLKNDEGDNFGIWRTVTAWDIVLTVYFMNPERTASGDEPPSPPGSETC